MELEEAIELKLHLEKDIFESVTELCSDFYNKTGLVVIRVDINTQDVTTMGEEIPSTIFTHCTTNVNI